VGTLGKCDGSPPGAWTQEPRRKVGLNRERSQSPFVKRRDLSSKEGGCPRLQKPSFGSKKSAGTSGEELLEEASDSLDDTSPGPGGTTRSSKIKGGGGPRAKNKRDASRGNILPGVRKGGNVEERRKKGRVASEGSRVAKEGKGGQSLLQKNIHPSRKTRRMKETT